MQKSGKKVNHIDACFDKKHRKEKHMRKKCITGLLLISLCTGLVIPAHGNAAQREMETQCYQENTDR